MNINLKKLSVTGWWWLNDHYGYSGIFVIGEYEINNHRRVYLFS